MSVLVPVPVFRRVSRDVLLSCLRRQKFGDRFATPKVGGGKLRLTFLVLDHVSIVSRAPGTSI